MLIEKTQAQALASMDRAETETLTTAMGTALRRFLNRLTATAITAIRQAPNPSAIIAAIGPSGSDIVWPLNSGEVAGWWADAVSEDVMQAVRDAWRIGYEDTSDEAPRQSSLDGLDLYLAQVSDRLVEGLVPPLPDDAMDKVRVAVTQAAQQGWSTQDLAQRIAAVLSWETDGPYWRAYLDEVNAEIDALLDPLGPPGTPARETARLTDPIVANLQAERAQAVLALDAEQSYWQVRANRIARTEAVGSYNAATLAALADEGVTGKQWVSTRDARTRPTHIAADGQTVPLGEPFIVGGSALMMPGDPSGPASDTINCRCTIINADVGAIALPSPMSEGGPL